MDSVESCVACSSVNVNRGVSCLTRLTSRPRNGTASSAEPCMLEAWSSWPTPTVLAWSAKFIALGKALGNTDAAGPAAELIDALMGDLKDRSDSDDAIDNDLSSEEIKTKALSLLEKAVITVESKCPVDVAWGYKRWILSIAKATAEASKEGSFLGFGGTRVTQNEHDALAEIEAILDI